MRTNYFYEIRRIMYAKAHSLRFCLHKSIEKLFFPLNWRITRKSFLLFIFFSFAQYAVLLFLLLVTQIVIGVLVFTNKREVQRVSDRILNNLWRDRQNHRAFWDTIQSGVSSPLIVLPFMCLFAELIWRAIKESIGEEETKSAHTHCAQSIYFDFSFYCNFFLRLNLA